MEQRRKGNSKAAGDGRVRKAARPEAEEQAAEVVRPPDRLRLLAAEIDIVFVAGLTEGNHAAFGVYDDKKSTVSVLEGCSKSATQDTIVHELMHAILQAYELDSEKIVRALTPGVLSMIRDNPELVRYLQS